MTPIERSRDDERVCAFLPLLTLRPSGEPEVKGTSDSDLIRAAFSSKPTIRKLEELNGEGLASQRHSDELSRSDVRGGHLIQKR